VWQHWLLNRNRIGRRKGVLKSFVKRFFVGSTAVERGCGVDAVVVLFATIVPSICVGDLSRSSFGTYR